MKTASGGISGVGWTLKVPMTYQVIIPAWNGIALDRDHPDIYGGWTYLAYPRMWQAQMFLIQGDEGGLLVYADDDGTQFKGLGISNDGTDFRLEISTIPQAPFTEYREFETVTWRICAYKGSWTDGADLYRAFMERTFHLRTINSREPVWAKDIQLVWMDDLDSLYKLQLLAREVDPSKVLIHIPGWRAASYDTEYPDYTPKDGIVDLIRSVKEMGFKVSLHCNMLGCAFDSDAWRNGMENEACLDAYSLEPVVEGYTAGGVDYRFGQINQASVAWQDLMVETMTEVVEETGADCIHLDQSLLCFNDGRGYVNGMTTMQGNVELQRRLAQALPGVAFSGEGMNEFSMRYADFIQQHVYGLDNPTRSWSDDAARQIVPLVTYLFDEYARSYHYPALPTADTANTDYYMAWYLRGNLASGLIPCLYRESVTSIVSPSQVFTAVLNDVRTRVENTPEIRRGTWPSGSVIAFTLKNGKHIRWDGTSSKTYYYQLFGETE